MSKIYWQMSRKGQKGMKCHIQEANTEQSGTVVTLQTCMQRCLVQILAETLDILTDVLVTFFSPSRDILG
jgi:hypothetical protein